VLDLQTTRVSYDPVSAEKGNYKHFMLKEIHEQPRSLTDTIAGRVDLTDEPNVDIEELTLTPSQVAAVRRIMMVGMGTSLHAAMVGRLFFEQIAGIPAEVDNASELRYRQPILSPDTLMVAVTQSGETVDTLAALEEGRRHSTPQLAITNVVGSEASRVVTGSVYTRCGVEIGVASTKTFTASIVAQYLAACWLGKQRGFLAESRLRMLLDQLRHLPVLAGRVIELDAQIQAIAQKYARSRHFLFLGRGLQFPIAMEGALKLKEVSYIHAEGYAAGEMKHGPIALVDDQMPALALAVNDGMFDKMLSNVQQVKAREGGRIIAIATEGETRLDGIADELLFVPDAGPYLTPVLTAIPLQLLSYHIATSLGKDVDQPRNLAKTVTVE